MKIESIECKEFTLFNTLKLYFSPHINIITGLNGVSKTILHMYVEYMQ